MDISKLPKLSNSPAPPPASEPAPPAEPSSPATAPPSMPDYQQRGTPATPIAAEVWISIGLGLLILLFFPNTVKYVAAKVTGGVPGIYLDPTPGVAPGTKCDYINWIDNAGNVIKHEMYRDTLTFWSDLAISAFGLVLILDGLVLGFVRKPAIVLLTFFLTVAAVLGNLLYLIKNFDERPLVSALAVIVGGYIAMTQWGFLNALRHRAAVQKVSA